MYLTLQVVPILTPQEFDAYSNNTMIYFDNDSEKLYEYAEQIQYNISHNIYAFNCSAYKQFCDSKRVKLPQLAVRYRNSTLFALDEITSAEQMLQIITTLESDQLIEKSLPQDCYTHYYRTENWFLVQGPDKEVYLDAMEIFKGKIAGCYVFSQQNSIQSIHRVGKENIVINFTSTFDKFQMEKFFERNLYSVFGRFDQSLVDRIFPQYKIGLFVFNPADQQQKQQAKEFRNIISEIIQQQEPIATDIVYMQTTFNNQQLLQFFQQIQLKNNRPQFLVLSPQRYVQYDYESLENKLQLKAFLEDVRSGQLKPTNQQQQQEQEQKQYDDFIDQQTQQEMKDEL